MIKLGQDSIGRVDRFELIRTKVEGDVTTDIFWGFK